MEKYSNQRENGLNNIKIDNYNNTNQINYRYTEWKEKESQNSSEYTIKNNINNISKDSKWLNRDGRKLY